MSFWTYNFFICILHGQTHTACISWCREHNPNFYCVSARRWRMDEFVPISQEHWNFFKSEDVRCSEEHSPHQTWRSSLRASLGRWWPRGSRPSPTQFSLFNIQQSFSGELHSVIVWTEIHQHKLLPKIR